MTRPSANPLAAANIFFLPFLSLLLLSLWSFFSFFLETENKSWQHLLSYIHLFSTDCIKPLGYLRPKFWICTGQFEKLTKAYPINHPEKCNKTLTSVIQYGLWNRWWKIFNNSFCVWAISSIYELEVCVTRWSRWHQIHPLKKQLFTTKHLMMSSLTNKRITLVF